jgi:glucose-6-phosphate 1-dehydrogenase
VDQALWGELREALYYQAGEFTDAATYSQLASLLGKVAARHGTGGNVLFYLAVPPSSFKAFRFLRPVLVDHTITAVVSRNPIPCSVLCKGLGWRA